MQKPLVSIITPCYNGEKYLDRFLDSILSQTYSCIQFIIVNDGSTDGTQEIINNYKKLFDKKGYEYIFVKKENGGQASAINEALPLVKGEFLSWPDSDDYLPPQSIELKVDYLLTHPKAGLVITQTGVYDEENPYERIGLLSRKFKNEYESLFDDLLFEHNAPIANGGYLVRTKNFFEALPSKHIYESKIGQNWQMLLPITHENLCGHIDKELYHYLVHADSHSHCVVSFEDQKKRTFVHEDCLLTVLSSLNLDNYKEYERAIKIKYIRKRMSLAFNFKEFSVVCDEYKCLKKLNVLDLRYGLLSLRARCRSFNFLYRLLFAFPLKIMKKIFLFVF